MYDHAPAGSAATTGAGVIGTAEGGTHYDYDYIAEWVNHRSDEVGLQLDFIDGITEIVEMLRSVDRPLRTDTFRAEMSNLERSLAARSDWFGFEPCGAATEPRYKIEHFVLADCRVFRTKARAPSLVACVVRRDDAELEWAQPALAAQQKSRSAVAAGAAAAAGAGAGTSPHGASDSSDLASPEPRNSNSNSNSYSNSYSNGMSPDDGRASMGVFHRREGQAVAKELAAAEGMLEQLSHSENVAKAAARARAGSEEITPPPLGAAAVISLAAAAEAEAASGGTSPSSTASDRPPVPERRGSRLASHAKTVSTSLLHQSRSIEKELDSSFGTASAAVPGVVEDSNSPGGGGGGGGGGGDGGRAVSAPSSLAHHHREGERGGMESIADVVDEDAETERGSDGSQPSSASASASAGGRLHVRHFSLDKNTGQKSAIAAGLDEVTARPAAAHPPLSPGAAKAAARAEEDAAAEEERLHAEVTKKVVASARALLTAGKISDLEFDTLINCDTRYRDEAARTEVEMANARLEECFGEPWEEHKERVLSEYVSTHPSPVTYKHAVPDDLLSTALWPELDLRCFIVKSNDDLRQEVCCLQLIELSQEIFADVTSHGSSAKCDLWLKTYRIASTNSTTGLVQVIPDTMSLDALKKTEGFLSLPRHFERVFGTSPERLHKAKKDFVASLAAYSVVCYIFQIKDRHNGNILLDRDGHIIHIDFGFLLGIAPGGSFSIESAPFKLTEEMVDTFGGLDSPYFSEFLRAFTSGFLALRANSETIVSTLSLMSTQSTFPCFAGKDTNVIIDKLRGRFRTDLSVKDTVQHCLDLIIESYSHYGTKQYDNFQWLTNGIVQ
jgi:hypothetical protein